VEKVGFRTYGFGLPRQQPREVATQYQGVSMVASWLRLCILSATLKCLICLNIA
jgi:hypothetical protein